MFYHICIIYKIYDIIYLYNLNEIETHIFVSLFLLEKGRKVMECTKSVISLDWNQAVRKAHEELNSLRQMEMIFGTTVTIMTRVMIIEEALKLYEKGDMSEELYKLLMGN